MEFRSWSVLGIGPHRNHAQAGLRLSLPELMSGVMRGAGERGGDRTHGGEIHINDTSKTESLQVRAGEYVSGDRINGVSTDTEYSGDIVLQCKCATSVQRSLAKPSLRETMRWIIDEWEALPGDAQELFLSMASKWLSRLRT